MKRLKLSRNLWLFAGFGFLLSFLLNLSDHKPFILLTLNLVTCFLSFINAHINQKKIIEESKK